MDINSIINWTAGMEITAEALKAMAHASAARDAALMRSVFGSRVGILPNVDFKCEGIFVRKSLEYDVKGCLALLPSGKLLDVEEKGSIGIPSVGDGDYYLTVGFGEGCVEFERNEVPMTRPVYAYAVRAFDELGKMDEIPLLRLHVEGGEVAIDREYIAPCMLMSSDSRLLEARDNLVARMDVVARHPNLEPGSPKQMMLQHLYLLKSLSPERRVDEFITLSEEIAHSVRFYIMKPYSDESVEIPEASQYDIRIWFNWLDGFLASATSILDGVVLHDDKIDYDTLKEQLRSDLYETLQPELSKALQDKMDALRYDLQTQVSEALKDFISGEFRRQLHDDLGVELSDELGNKLYSSLYEALYEALFVPPKVEEDTYTPLI